MKKNVIMQSLALVCMTGAFAVSAACGTNESEKKLVDVGSVEVAADRNAGVASVFTEYEMILAEGIDQKVSIESRPVEIVAAAKEESTEETVEEKKETAPKLSKEEKEWQSYLMADVNDYLNVRKEASEKSEVVGKMNKGDRAKVVEVGEEWTKIKSGNVEGYVKNDFCLTGTEALNYAKKNCKTVAKVVRDGLRLREEQSTESGIIRVLSAGEVFVVDTSVETEEDWVAVLADGKKCFVSANYVELSLKTGKAITIEEEKAIEAAKQAKAATKTESNKTSSNKQTTGASTTKGEAVAATPDDVTLLGALIQCEAGGQIYECQLAVGSVVMNRIRSSVYPNSLREVIYQRSQFGPAGSGKLARRLQSGVSSIALRAAREALSGVDNTNGAMYFKLASSGHSGVVYGPVVFY